MAYRAHHVQSEYERHAHYLDRTQSPAGTQPVYDLLQSYGTVRGLVVGAYAEMSADIMQLIQIAAGTLASRRWSLMGARTQAEARAFFLQHLTRRFGLTAAREMARHRLHRVQYVGVPRAVVEDRMRAAAAPRPAHAEPLIHHGEFAGWQGNRIAIPVRA